MHTYANIQNGIVIEIISPMVDSDNNEIPIANRFTPAVVANLVDVTTVSPQPSQGWSYSNSVFSPPAGPSLADYQAFQIATLNGDYDQASTQPVSYTSSAGISKTFDADPNSQIILTQAMQGYDISGAVPAGFYWVAADNTQVPFTLADLKGLYAAMLAQGWTAFQHLQTQKAAVRSATTVAAVESITW